jgi:uracil-DNA glycosylase family 4
MIHPIVLGDGSRTTSIALVGEAPGFNEAKLRRPFVGRAGEKLVKILHDCGLTRQELYITNVIKERPGEKDNDVSDWFKINKWDVWVSADYLEYVEILRKELLGLSQMTVVVPLGNVALYALTGLTKITKRRGSILESTLIPGLKCIPTIHPASADRNYIQTYFIRHDFLLIKEECKTREITLPSRHIIVEPTYYETLEFLRMIKDVKQVEVETRGNDIEVMNEEISCISFSISPTEGISIPFVLNGADYFTPDQELEIWKEIASILEDPNIKKIGHNYIFDMSFIYRKYGIITRNFDCSMIAQGIAYPDFPKGLDFVTSMNTREPYYKDDGKKWLKTGGSYRDFWVYNAKDSLVCQESFPKIFNIIKKQGNEETYNYQRDLIHPLMYMQARGMRVDVENKNKASEEAEKKTIEHALKLAGMLDMDTSFKVGSDPDMYRVTDKVFGTSSIYDKSAYNKIKRTKPVFNMLSTNQLADLFYNKLGHKAYLNKGKVTTNDDALKRLVRIGVKEAIVIRDVRRILKLKSTYYDMKLSADNRLRSSMNPIGTVSGRLSSSQDIFGEGGNVQNLPTVMQQFILADDGYIMYAPDLSQAENRTTANIAPEPLMLKAFADNIDIHCLTASMISNIPMPEIKQQDKDNVYCSLGTGEYTWRFWGKKSNHSLNYDLGYKTFALRFEMPETQAKQLVERFHRVYPGIRQYHAWVRALLSENRTLTNCFGRKRVFLDKWGDELFKEAYSWIPQSSIADKVNRQGILFIHYNQQLFHFLELLNQIHDSLLFQIPISIGWEKHAEMLIHIRDSLERPMVWHGNSFVIPLEFKLGYNMKDTKKVGIDKDETVGRLARKLHDIHSELGTPRQLPSVDRDICDSSFLEEEMLSGVGDVYSIP